MVVQQRIGRYEVLGQLATGGMAEILLARIVGPASFARAVVIKRILPQYARTRTFEAMFLDEARTIASIRHPNVVQVQELGEDAGEVFLVLEYVAGENLSSVLRRSVAVGEPLAPRLVAHIIAEACAGLHAAHELVSDAGRHQKLVHRDVSPQNLFVAYDGHVKLLDFGVALTEERIARTEVGDVKGKFEYMSPEQASAEPLDRRSDIFAMGIVLYELATGRRLFKRNMPSRTLDAICREPVTPPSRVVDGFPPALEAIIMKALAKKPDERFATAADMRRDLLEVSREVPQPVEAVAEHMHRWFPERIAEKEEMLRRVSEGTELARVPAGEIDDDVRVPNAPSLPIEVVEPSAEARPAPLAPAPVGSTRRGLALLAISALALALMVATFALVRTKGRTSALASANTGAPSGSAMPPTSVTPPVSATPSSTTTAPEVLVHVESLPAGAHVLVDGTERGLTPVDLHLTRGAAPLVLELRRNGFAATTQTIVPDADQKLVLSLRPGRGGPPRAGGTPASSGFRRFD